MGGPNPSPGFGSSLAPHDLTSILARVQSLPTSQIPDFLLASGMFTGIPGVDKDGLLATLTELMLQTT